MPKSYEVILNDSVVKRLQDIVGSASSETIIDFMGKDYEYYAKKLKFMDEEGQEYPNEPTININVPRFISFLQSIGYNVDDLVNYYNTTLEPSYCKLKIISAEHYDVNFTDAYFDNNIIYFGNDSGLYFSILDYSIYDVGESEYRPDKSISTLLIENRDELESISFAYTFSNILDVIRNNLQIGFKGILGCNVMKISDEEGQSIVDFKFSLVDFDKFIDCFDIYNE